MQRSPDAIPELVLLHLWGVSPAGVPRAVARMGTHRLRLRRASGLRFAKLLGTGDGRTFTARDADPLHWGLLTVWDDAHDGERFAADSGVVRSWQRLATETLVVRLSPIAARGTWAGDTPFGDPRPRPVAGPVASITRARIATRKWAGFWRAVPPVSHDLHQVGGLRMAVGIGEAPVGLQGTFSMWDSSAALNEFAHRREPHQEVVRRTAQEGWYSEELFARFEVLSTQGSFEGRSYVTTDATTDATDHV
ncbi:MAG TPA: hypothetical protein VF661_12585 [Actinomycetales bacterium]|jgi:hypothetical protein